MKIASVANVKARLSAYIRESQSGPIIITRNGKAVAALLHISDDDEIERILMAHSPRLRALLQQAEAQIESGKGLSHEEVWESET